MTKIKFLCRSCNTELQTKEDTVHKNVRCPHCGGRTVVPTRSEEALYRDRLKARKEEEKNRRRAEKEEEKKDRQTVETIGYLKSHREEEKKRQTEEGEKGNHRRVEDIMFSQSVAPVTSVRFLNVMGGILIIIGALVLIAGIVTASDNWEKEETRIIPFACLGIGIQLFWIAALTFVVTSVAQNIFGIHKKLESIDHKLTHTESEEKQDESH